MRYSFVFGALTTASLVTASYLDDYSAYSRRDNQDIDAYIQARNYDAFQFNLMPRAPEPKGTSGGGAPKAAAPAGGGGGKPAKAAEGGSGGKAAKASEGSGGGKAAKASEGSGGGKSAKGSEGGSGGKAAKGSGEGVKPGKEGKGAEGGSKGASKEGKAGAKEGRASGEKAGLKSAGKEGKEGKEKGSSSKFPMGKSEGSSKKASSGFGSYKGSRTSSLREGFRSKSSMMDRLRKLSPIRTGRSRSEGKAGGASERSNKPSFKSKEEVSRYLTRPGSPKGVDRSQGRSEGMNAGMGGAGMKANQIPDAAMAARDEDGDRSITKLHRRDFADAYVMIRKRSGRGDPNKAKAEKQELPWRLQALHTEAPPSRLPRLEHIMQQSVKDSSQGHPPPPANSRPPQQSAGPSNSGTMNTLSTPTLGKKTNSEPNLSRIRQVRMAIRSPSETIKPPAYPKQPRQSRILVPGDRVLGNAVPFPRRTQGIIGNVPPPTRLREPSNYAEPTLQNTPTQPNQLTGDWVMDKWFKQSVAYDGHEPPS